MSLKKIAPMSPQESDPYVDPTLQILGTGVTSEVYELSNRENNRLHHVRNHVLRVDDFFLEGTQYVRKWIYNFKGNQVKDDKGRVLDANHQLLHEINMAHELAEIFKKSHNPNNTRPPIYVVPLLQWVVMLKKKEGLRGPGRESFQAFDELAENGQSSYREMYDQMEIAVNANSEGGDVRTRKSHFYHMTYGSALEKDVVPLLHTRYECQSAYLTFPRLNMTLFDYLTRFPEGRNTTTFPRGLFRLCREMLWTLQVLHSKHITHGDVSVENFLLGFDQNKIEHLYLSDFGRAVDSSNATNIDEFIRNRADDIGGIAEVVSRMFVTIMRWYDLDYPVRSRMDDFLTDERRWHYQKHQNIKIGTPTLLELSEFSLTKIARLVNMYFHQLFDTLHLPEEDKISLDVWWPINSTH
jgi:serine/threonine protein kinase